MVYWYYGTTREGNKNDAVSIRGRLHRSRENGKQKLRDGGGSDRCRPCKGGGRENLRGFEGGLEFKGRYGVALESIYDRDFAESLGVTYSELLKRVEKKANYISKECPQFDTLFGKDTQSWSNGGADSQLLVIVPWDESKETFESVAKWLDSIVYEI